MVALEVPEVNMGNDEVVYVSKLAETVDEGIPLELINLDDNGDYVEDYYGTFEQ